MDYQNGQMGKNPNLNGSFLSGNRVVGGEISRNPQMTGNRILEVSRQDGEAVDASAEAPSMAEQVEMLTPVEMGLIEPEAPQPDKDAVIFENIKNDAGDKLSKAALDEVMKLSQKLNRDGDTADFYKKVRGGIDTETGEDVVGAMDALLKGNYGREIGK